MRNYSATSLYIETESIPAATIIAVVGVFGLVSNSTAMMAVRLNPALRNSFGLLCFSNCVANLVVLLVFVFWITPLTLTESEIASKLIGKVIGQVNVMMWNVCVYSHLAVSVNRIIAIALPIQASTILTVRNTSYAVLLCWILGFCHIIPYFWTEQCYIVFNTITWIWTFADTPCGHVIAIFTDFYTGMAVFSATFLLDSTTLICLRLRHTVRCCSISFSIFSLRCEGAEYKPAGDRSERQKHTSVDEHISKEHV